MKGEMKNRMGMLAVLLVSGLVLAVMVNIIGVGSTFKENPNINVVFNLAQFLPPANDGETAQTDDSGAKRFLSIDDLNAFIKYSAQGLDYYGYNGYYEEDSFGIVTRLATSGVPKGKAEFETVDAVGSGASDYSTTNIQVEGVDEADIVKNDEGYIYVVSGRKVIIIDAYPAENAKVLSEIEFDQNPSEIFINGDKLVVFTQDYGRISRPYGYGSNTRANVAVYDVSDRKFPELERKISSDGNYFDSRMIGDYVYVIVNEPVYYRPCPVYGSGVVDMVEEFMAVDCVEQSITAPGVTIDGEETGQGFPDIYYWDTPDRSYHFTTILAINTQNDKEKPGRKIFLMGDAQNMFVSLGNIYVTRTKWVNDYEVMEKVYDEVVIPSMPRQTRAGLEEIEFSNNSFNMKRLERAEVVKEYIANLDEDELRELNAKINEKTQEIKKGFENTREQTAINKIAINKGKITPKASGSVPGTVLNQFSMDEYAGNFRIATTTQKGSDNQANNLYVLDEDLKLLGKIEEIAPGESIYSARFLGKRAYMVTFKRVDPLFVIDLSNPKKPKLLGKLKIPGYSDYLHPYDENHLIGIGKEVDESIDADKVHSSDAVYYTAIQGVKLAIFDVSDVEHPVEMYKEVIGDRGTESEALNDHKAFLFDKEKGILVLPMLVAEVSEAQKKADKEWRSREGDFTFQGAYVYGISLDKGFEFRGRVTHLDDKEALMKSGYYFNSPYSVKRSLYMDDTLYTISDKKIKMNYLRGLGEINEVELPYEEGNNRGYY